MFSIWDQVLRLYVVYLRSTQAVHLKSGLYGKPKQTNQSESLSFSHSYWQNTWRLFHKTYSEKHGLQPNSSSISVNTGLGAKPVPKRLVWAMSQTNASQTERAAIASAEHWSRAVIKSNHNEKLRQGNTHLLNEADEEPRN